MLPVILFVVVIFIVAILVIASNKPDMFRIERSMRIHAPIAKVYPLINDFHQWVEWSPFEKLDPTMKKTYGGPESGKGATYGWEGNGKAGKGRMEITSTSPSKIDIALHFDKPMKAHNLTEFTLKPEGDATTVTWSMSGKQSLFYKVMCTFMNMDKMIGKSFVEGLTTMKTIAER